MSTAAAPMFSGGSMAPADVVVTDPSDWTVTLSMTVDTKVHLTATANKAPVGTGYSIEIHSLTAPSSNSQIFSCSSASTPVCSYTTTPGEAQSTYIAVVTPNNSSNAFPTIINAVSSTVTPPAWTASMTTEVTTTIKFTVTVNYDLQSPGRYIRVYDLSDNRSVGFWCSTGTVCVWQGYVPKWSDSRYKAYVTAAPSDSTVLPTTGVLATSDTFVPAPWTISLEGSGTSLTARTNYSLSGSGGRFIEIFDLSSQSAIANYIGWCSSSTPATTSCTLTTSSPGHQFIATAGSISNWFPPNPTLAVSNQVGLQGPTSPYETAGGSNPAELNHCYSCAGDPVNTSNGEFFENEQDITIPGRGPALSLSRTYSSQRAAMDGAFGYGWADPYSMALVERTDGTVEITQENGSRTVFTPNGAGGYTAPSRVLATLAKNGDGSWTYTRKTRSIFTFTAAGKLAATSDLNGNTLTLAYTAGKLSSVTDGGSRSIAFAYGTNGKISTATDPASRVTSYGYDAAGRLTSVTAPGGRVTQYGYDAGNLLTSMTDPLGSVTVNTYDQARRVTKQTTAAGDLRLSYGYESTNGLTTITSPGGRVTKETYSGGQLIKRTVGVGTAQQSTWNYAYDQTTFARTSVTDPLNRTTIATYDGHGNKTSVTDIGGHQTTATYNSLDQVLTSTDAAGTTTTNTYDAAGNLLTSSTPLNGSQTATTTFTYSDTNHPGDVTAITDPNGHTTTIGYDSHGNQTTVTDALGRATTTAYDILGRETSTTSPGGKTTAYVYDGAGHLATVTDALGKSTATSYDAGGNPLTVTDPMSRVTTFTYDALGRRTSVTAPDSTVSHTGYDNDGNVTSQTDPANHGTTYAYDALNRLTTVTNALSRTTSYTYDTAGQLTGITDASGRTTTHSYNTAGDKTGTSYSNGTTPNETFTYTARHQLATMTDGTGTTTASYDAFGRLTSRTNGAGKTISYGYDLAGNITSQTYSNSQTVTRNYDAANHLTSLTDWQNNTTNFTTNSDGQTATTAYANGVTATTGYDGAGRLGSITVATSTATLATFGYTRNDNGNLSGTTTTGITQPAESYTYTDRDELATINVFGYAYDTAGNPTTLATGASLSYDAANQATQYTVAGTTTPITYDNQGNRIAGPTLGGTTANYSWNQANRLIAANGTTYSYSADGLRASRTPTTGPAQAYVWDASLTVPLMLSDGSTSYIYDNTGTPVEHIDSSGTVRYYQHDQYGSTRLLTNNTGAVTATYTYDPYGNITQQTGTTDTPLRWNGQSQDTDTGLYYLRARYYDPQTAQFISVDPVAALTGKKFNYADNNPLNSSDPLGLFALASNTYPGRTASADKPHCQDFAEIPAPDPVTNGNCDELGRCSPYGAAYASNSQYSYCSPSVGCAGPPIGPPKPDATLLGAISCYVGGYAVLLSFIVAPISTLTIVGAGTQLLGCS